MEIKSQEHFIDLIEENCKTIEELAEWIPSLCEHIETSMTTKEGIMDQYVSQKALGNLPDKVFVISPPILEGNDTYGSHVIGIIVDNDGNLKV